MSDSDDGGQLRALIQRIDDLKTHLQALEHRVQNLEEDYRQTYSNVHLHGHRTQEHHEILTRLNDLMQRYIERFDRFSESLQAIQNTMESYHTRIHNLETATNSNSRYSATIQWIIRTLTIVVLTSIATTFWNLYFD